MYTSTQVDLQSISKCKKFELPRPNSFSHSCITLLKICLFGPGEDAISFTYYVFSSKSHFVIIVYQNCPSQKKRFQKLHSNFKY